MDSPGGLVEPTYAAPRHPSKTALLVAVWQSAARSGGQVNGPSTGKSEGRRPVGAIPEPHHEPSAASPLLAGRLPDVLVPIRSRIVGTDSRQPATSVTARSASPGASAAAAVVPATTAPGSWRCPLSQWVDVTPTGRATRFRDRPRSCASGRIPRNRILEAKADIRAVCAAVHPCVRRRTSRREQALNVGNGSGFSISWQDPNQERLHVSPRPILTASPAPLRVDHHPGRRVELRGDRRPHGAASSPKGAAGPLR